MPNTNNKRSKEGGGGGGGGSGSHGHSTNSNMFETQFFLYTPKLNENATKNLRKASTNKEERQVLG